MIRGKKAAIKSKVTAVKPRKGIKNIKATKKLV